MNVLAIAAAISALVGAFAALFFAIRAREQNSSVANLDRAFDAALDDAPADARPSPLAQQAQPRPTEQLRTIRADRDAATRNKDRSLTITVISAGITVAFLVASIVATSAAKETPQEAIACPEQIERVISIAKNNPRGWVPLLKDDPYQQTCRLNQVFARITNPRPPGAPTSTKSPSSTKSESESSSKSPSSSKTP